MHGYFGCPGSSDEILRLTFHFVPISYVYKFAKMDQAIAYKQEHPGESFSSVSNLFQVPSSTLHDHFKGSHAAEGRHGPRNLSIEQEHALIRKINEYDERGTLLTPKHIKELAIVLCGHDLGRNWSSTFLRRNADMLSSRCYRVQEQARLAADAPEHRQAFYALVSLSTARSSHSEKRYTGNLTKCR